MRAVVQRVAECEVRVSGERVSRIGSGLLVLLGVSDTDGEGDARWLAEKVAHLRVFEDEGGKMNRSLLETGGEMMVVSQFTLLGDCRKGRRPSFVRAAAPEPARRLYRKFLEAVREKGVRVATGRFQTEMAVVLVNDGPVTLLVESPS
jgi:D-tyrosyl-tRNA(Tyr) deacylase